MSSERTFAQTPDHPSPPSPSSVVPQVEFCCDSFAEVITHEYEDDLGRIRRQAALWRRRGALGELDEDAELLAAALSAASSEQQPPAKITCLMEKRTRLKALQRYGQEGTATGKAPQLLPFDFDVAKKGRSGPVSYECIQRYFYDTCTFSLLAVLYSVPK